MSLNERIRNATIGVFNYEDYTHPLFRKGEEQARMWGRFTLQSNRQDSDINAHNTLNMGLAKDPAATTIGAKGK